MTRPAADIVKVTWSGTGTGTMTLGAAVSGFNAFPSTLNGQVISYSIEHQTSPEREAGYGTYTHSGTTLTRTLVTASTNGGALVNFSSGEKHVRISALTSDLYENRAATDPTSADSSSLGYRAGRSTWFNTATKTYWICRDDTPSSAVWGEIVLADQIGSIDGSSIVQGTIPLAKLALGTENDLITYDGDGVAINVSGAGYVNPSQATDNQVTTGTATNVLSYSPAQLKLSAETHGGGGGGGIGDETEDSATTITVGFADNTHKALTGAAPITLLLSQSTAVGVRQAFTPKTDQVVTVDPASQARYLVPGDTNASLSTAVSNGVWGTPSGNNVTITSATSLLPDYAAGDLFQIRNHSVAANNGFYIATGAPGPASLPATKIDGTAPQAAASEAVDVDTLQRQTNFILTGYGEFECISNVGGSAAVWRFDGASNLPSTIEGTLAVTAASNFSQPITLSGSAAVTGGAKIVSDVELKDIAETAHDAGTLASGAVTFDYTNGGYQFGTTGAGNITSVSIINPPATGRVGCITLEITQGATARTIVWGAAFSFPGGTDFTLTASAGAVDIFTFITRNGGTNWRGFEGGKAFLP